jgi:hypothetical protein
MQSILRDAGKGLEKEKKKVQPRHVANTLHTLLGSSCHFSPIWCTHGIVITCSALDTRRVATVFRVAFVADLQEGLLQECSIDSKTTTTSQRRIER